MRGFRQAAIELFYMIAPAALIAWFETRSSRLILLSESNAAASFCPAPSLPCSRDLQKIWQRKSKPIDATTGGFWHGAIVGGPLVWPREALIGC